MPKGKTILIFLAISIAVAYVSLDVWWLRQVVVKGWTMLNITYIGQPLAETFINTLLFGGQSNLSELVSYMCFFLINLAIGIAFFWFGFSRFRDIAIDELLRIAVRHRFIS